ncbi:DUF2147 domain-containing protein [Alkalicaulis satelles]|uniref:DUF2147 domain-containing protein n=1 Tax=Alkalicaulis satelles TaxID=2609175 RepID=A0A5M6ZC32_9PROT|nr:DUF2147 domain-containing protein [Alkalicaulis satelles]KAA5802283.1 DUF2147 domain-containing protein [Alkalicaulis satelles]
MKRALILASLAMLQGPAAALAGTASVPAPAGIWLTPAGGAVEISACGEALCGQLIDAQALQDDPDLRDENNRDPALRSRPLRGVDVLNGFTGGPQTWTGGALYDPESGRAAGRGRLTLADADTLEVRGCIAPLLCQTQTWTRRK